MLVGLLVAAAATAACPRAGEPVCDARGKRDESVVALGVGVDGLKVKDITRIMLMTVCGAEGDEAGNSWEDEEGYDEKFKSTSAFVSKLVLVAPPAAIQDALGDQCFATQEPHMLLSTKYAVDTTMFFDEAKGEEWRAWRDYVLKGDMLAGPSASVLGSDNQVSLKPPLFDAECTGYKYTLCAGSDTGSDSNTAAIAGGVAGGVVLCAVIGFVIVRRRPPAAAREAAAGLL